MDALKALYPESDELAALSDETRLNVSERPGVDELHPPSPRV
jgi:hypothetical protein